MNTEKRDNIVITFYKIENTIYANGVNNNNTSIKPINMSLVNTGKFVNMKLHQISEYLKPHIINAISTLFSKTTIDYDEFVKSSNTISIEIEGSVGIFYDCILHSIASASIDREDDPIFNRIMFIGHAAYKVKGIINKIINEIDKENLTKDESPQENKSITIYKGNSTIRYYDGESSYSIIDDDGKPILVDASIENKFKSILSFISKFDKENTIIHLVSDIIVDYNDDDKWIDLFGYVLESIGYTYNKCESVQIKQDDYENIYIYYTMDSSNYSVYLIKESDPYYITSKSIEMILYKILKILYEDNDVANYNINIGLLPNYNSEFNEILSSFNQFYNLFMVNIKTHDSAIITRSNFTKIEV